jgi:hypothetical protein
MNVHPHISSKRQANSSNNWHTNSHHQLPTTSTHISSTVGGILEIFKTDQNRRSRRYNSELPSCLIIIESASVCLREIAVLPHAWPCVNQIQAWFPRCYSNLTLDTRETSILVHFYHCWRLDLLGAWSGSLLSNHTGILEASTLYLVFQSGSNITDSITSWIP